MYKNYLINEGTEENRRGYKNSKVSNLFFVVVDVDDTHTVQHTFHIRQ